MAEPQKSLAVYLREARDLVARGHAKGACACNANGSALHWSALGPGQDAGATSWDPVGALSAVLGRRGPYLECSALLKRANGLSSSTDLGEWNDAPERTQAQVVAAFSRAIELAISEGR